MLIVLNFIVSVIVLGIFCFKVSCNLLVKVLMFDVEIFNLSDIFCL